MNYKMFEIIFLIGISLYFIQLIIFTIGAGKSFKQISYDELPSATVIVAARNEEDNILECMESLNKLIYPEGKLEIILVNDKSTDKTGEIIESFIKDKPHFKMLIPSKSIGSLKGKTNALANALKIATGEIIATTDADCTVRPEWIQTLASYYDKNVALVGGYTAQQSYSAFTGMQSIDFIYLLTVAAGAMNFNKPLSCIGNNMSYRKSVYDEIGGYENLEFSVTEDFNLLMAMHSLKKYKIITPLDPGLLVVSKPCPDFKTLYWQKKRWGVGGMKSDVIGYSVMLWGFITHIAILLLPFMFSLTALYITLFKIITDYFFLYPVFKKLNMNLRLSHFFTFQVYFIIYVIVLPFIVLPSQKVKWKGREF